MTPAPTAAMANRGERQGAMLAPDFRQGYSRVRATCICLGAICLLLAGCARVGYYAQAALGQASLLLARQDARALSEDPRTAPALAAKLRLIESLLRYARLELALPVGNRYRGYVELPGAPVWNLVVAPEFDVAAREYCYPIAGCAIYRGYFSRRAAEREAARLAVDHDVHIAAAAAYSTLGWFNDPILSSFIHYDEAALADLLFHELAHSVVYVRGDSAFNESFASFVGNQGASAWLAARGGDPEAYQARLAADRALFRFLAGWRQRLADLYRQDIADDAKRQLKAELFAAMGADYRRARRRLGDGRHDAAMDRPFNNARLALSATYRGLYPGFAELFRTVGGDWRAFYAAVGELAALSPDARRAALFPGARQGALGDQ